MFFFHIFSVYIPRLVGLKEGQPPDGINWMGMFKKTSNADQTVTPYR